MTSIKTFLTEIDAMVYCEQQTERGCSSPDFLAKPTSLIIIKELDGRFHIYDADK